ncbi:MAG: FeoA family protein [Candidatus Bathyarchaeota archaeon]|jgi:ferrous iron transport protein A
MELQSSTNSQCKTLAEMKVGQRARVVKLLVKGLTRRRLLDLGLLPGTEVKAIMRSPLGDPTAYDIRGSILALRSEDASKILVRILSSNLDEDVR